MRLFRRHIEEPHPPPVENSMNSMARTSSALIRLEAVADRLEGVYSQLATTLPRPPVEILVPPRPTPDDQEGAP